METTSRTPTNPSDYPKGRKVEIRNANGVWRWDGVATGRIDCRGIEVSVYAARGYGTGMETAFYHAGDVRPA